MASARVHPPHDHHVLRRPRRAVHIRAQDARRPVGAIRRLYDHILCSARVARPLRKVRVHLGDISAISRRYLGRPPTKCAPSRVVVLCLGGSSLALYGRCAAEPVGSPIRPLLTSEGAGTLEVCRRDIAEISPRYRRDIAGNARGAPPPTDHAEVCC